MVTKKRLLVSGIALSLATASPAVAACSQAMIAGTWDVQVTVTDWDLQFGGPPTTNGDSCLFRIERGQPGTARVTIYCEDDRAFAAARNDFPGLDSEHELVRQRGETIETTDGTLLQTRNRCEWLLIDRADLDGGEYIIRFSAPDSNGRLQVFHLSGEGYLDHHFGSTEPKIVTAQGIAQ